MALKVVIYARAGQKNAHSKSVQLKPQLEALYAAADRFKMTVIGEFSEVMDAWQPVLPQLDAAIDFAEANGANLLVVRIDRFGTDLETMRSRLQAIGERGVKVWLESGAFLDALTIENLRYFKPKKKTRAPNQRPSPLKGTKRAPAS
jgi:DNA invertase Pin-like site-specific DNA recombinase